MDCKTLICELMSDLRTVKVSYLEEQLMWHGIEKHEIALALKTLQERGVIYRRKSGSFELTEPANT